MTTTRYPIGKGDSTVWVRVKYRQSHLMRGVKYSVYAYVDCKRKAVAVKSFVVPYNEWPDPKLQNRETLRIRKELKAELETKLMLGIL